MYFYYCESKRIGDKVPFSPTNKYRLTEQCFVSIVHRVTRQPNSKRWCICIWCVSCMCTNGFLFFYYFSLFSTGSRWSVVEQRYATIQNSNSVHCSLWKYQYFRAFSVWLLRYFRMCVFEGRIDKSFVRFCSPSECRNSSLFRYSYVLRVFEFCFYFLKNSVYPNGHRSTALKL